MSPINTHPVAACKSSAANLKLRKSEPVSFALIGAPCGPPLDCP
ncbi:hypothetical protein [Methylomonas fluvii]|nr:hypothetical protein [Methylomonas fluvii]